MINDLLQCVRREIQMRNNAYPKLVRKGTMTDEQARDETQRMCRVLAVLQTVQRISIDARRVLDAIADHPGAARDLVPTSAVQALLETLRALPEFVTVDERFAGTRPTPAEQAIAEAVTRIKVAPDAETMLRIYHGYDHVTDPRHRCALSGANAAWFAMQLERSPR